MVSVALNANPITEFQQETRRQELINEAEATKANPPKTQKNKPILKPQTPKLDGQLSTNKITTINVTGNTLLTPYEIHYIITPFKNKSLKSSDILGLYQTFKGPMPNAATQPHGYPSNHQITTKPLHWRLQKDGLDAYTQKTIRGLINFACGNYSLHMPGASPMTLMFAMGCARLND